MVLWYACVCGEEESSVGPCCVMLGCAVLCRTFGSGLWKMLFGEQVIYLFCAL